MPLLPVDTQRWLPWKETVTVTSVRPNSSDATATVTTAGVYRQGLAEGAPSRGVYTKYDVKVTVATDDVAFVPKPRDTVLWAGDTYTVLSVERSDWTKHYVLTARNLILAADLRQTGTLTRPAVAQDAAGRPARATYATVTGSIPCRVQPLGGQAADVLEKRTAPQRFTAYVGVPLDARAGDRFEVGAAYYTVLGSHDPETLDSLQSLDLEVILP